jgi:hypothetical protein
MVATPQRLISYTFQMQAVTYELAHSPLRVEAGRG